MGGVVVVALTQCNRRCVYPYRSTLASFFWAPCPCGHAPQPCTCMQDHQNLPQRPRAKPRRASLREALHVQDVEGMRQACIGAHVDAGTLNPAINTLIATARASGRRATLESSTRNPLEVSTNSDASARTARNVQIHRCSGHKSTGILRPLKTARPATVHK